MTYARIKDDWLRSDWCYNSRTSPECDCPVAYGVGKWLPETCRTFHGPSQMKFPPAWQKVITDLNASEPTALKYLNHLNSGWRNTGDPWQFECLSFAGNLVWVTNMNAAGDQAYVTSVDVSKVPPVLSPPLDFTHYPSIIHIFTVVTPDNKTTLPSIGEPKHDAWLYILGTMGDYRQRYIETRNLEFFPTLPFNATVTVGGLNVRNAPAGDFLRVLPQGTAFTILEYKPRANAVWGRISDGEWVAIEHPAISGWFSSTWRMETLPPPPL